MNYLNKIFFLVNEKKIIILSLIFLFFFSSIFEVLGIGLIGSLIAFLNDSGIENETFVGKFFYFFTELGFNISSPSSLAVFIICVLIVRLFFQLISNYIILSFTNNTSKNLRKKLISTYLNLNYLDFVNKDSSSSYNELTSLTDQFTNLLLVSLKLASDLILLIFIISMLLLVNIKIFFILFLLFLFLFSMNKIFFSKKIANLGFESNKLTEKIFKYFKDGLSGFKQIRVVNKTNFILEKISQSLKQHAQILIKYNFFLVFIRYFIELTIAIILIISAILIYRIYDEANALIVLSVFAISAIRILPIVTNLINSFNVLFYSKNAIDRLTTAIKLKKETIFTENRNEIQDFQFKSLQIKNLNFSYKDKKVLKNVSLDIYTKDLVLITGPSGSGKTTLLDIISGLIKTKNGVLAVNNHTSDEHINSFKSKIYYLSQKNFILNDTLTNNVAFAAYKIDQDRLDEAIRLSGLEIFRLKQKNNINEQLGEDASKISGGESQRIALARAIYANKEILILDEFTSSLDKENENKIFERIVELNKSKTIIIVSHNLNIKEIANKTFQLNEGELIRIK